MATTVTLTGTGVPHPSPGRAGPGVLVQAGGVAVQVDAGRGTLIRLAELGLAPADLSALLVTHVHSDHVVDLADVVMTRWVQGNLHPAGPLPLVLPEGEPERFARSMLEPFADDLALRAEHASHGELELEVLAFAPGPEPVEVWRAPGGELVVEAVAVHHEPVPQAVAYRITTPEAVVVVSGDTRICEEVELLARGADLLVHETCRVRAMAELIAGTPFEAIFSYHADSVQLGAIAQRAGVGHLMLTHLIPPPASMADELAFATDAREGGYEGEVTVGRDLVAWSCG